MEGPMMETTDKTSPSACIQSIILQDTPYAVCLMNTGLFRPNDYAMYDMPSEYLPMIASALNTTAENVNVRGCFFACSKATASASCCEAAARISSCTPTNPAVAECAALLEDAFELKGPCNISHENIGLLVGIASLVVMGTTLMVLSRRYARTQGQRAIAGLEGRLAAGALTGWSERVLAWWRQITNLVWKNWVLRRRKPVAFVMEQSLPVLFLTGLLFLTNLDSLFATERSSIPNEAQVDSTKVLVCSSINAYDFYSGGSMTSFYTSGQTVLGIFLLLSYIKFVSMTTTTMVIEKETRIREVMKIMGLSDRSLLVSWALTTALLSAPLTFIIAAELKFGNVFPGAEYATLVFLFWSFSMAIVAFSYFIAPFFNKSRTASITSVLLWLLLYFPFFSVQAKTNGTKYLAALSPPTAFALALDDLLRRAQLGTGFVFSLANAFKPVTVPSAFAMSWMLLLDSALLFLLGWYFEQVIPQQYGVRKPWNFVFKSKYWTTTNKKSDRDRAPLTSWSPVIESNTPRNSGQYSSMIDRARLQDEKASSPNSDNGSTSYMNARSTMGDRVDDELTVDFSVQLTQNATIEPVSTALGGQERKGSCLQIQGLRKVFTVEDGEKVAVHGLDLTLYSGQITALLGHNGAGKTTTISMLTGLFPPTSGDAKLYGRSITNDFNELRQIMGICPQHDVLFNDLTVQEHLELFGTMKNVPPQKLEMEVERMIQEVGLTEKRHDRAKNLSGGQKRKLSVALAFIGDSKLVFLDEPTSGMDPYSRRFTWNLLQRNREDRVIVLTTHFMDEADILGDRIAIMADGQLCCAGSSLFLKNRYGAGYNLTMIKGPDCDVDMVGQFLRQYVVDAKCLSNYGSEVVFQLPSHASGMFPSMLERLDQEMRALRIQQYGISVTTLEEVFLRIARDREDGGFALAGINPVDQLRTVPTDINQPTDRIASITTYEPTFATQFHALLRKRVRITKRDRKSLVNAICIPLLLLMTLVLLPEVKVASFLPDYTMSLPSIERQNECTAEDFAPFNSDDLKSCISSEYDYCSLGVIKCDAQVCCTQTNIQAPNYPCNTCSSIGKGGICYTDQCLERDGAKLQITLNGFLVALVVMLAFAFVPAAIVAFIVREKHPIQNAKILQLICGANVSAYWCSNWTHDIGLIFVSVFIAGVVVPLSTHALSSVEDILGMVALATSHALAVIPLAYLFSFRFTRHAVAQTSLLVFGLSTGGLLSIFSFLCRIVDFDLTPNTPGGLRLSDLDRNYLRWVFMLFPGYSLNNGIYELATRKISRSALFGDDSNSTPPSFFGLFEGLGRESCTECWQRNVPGCCVRNAFDIDVGGAPVLYALFEALVFSLLVFAIERGSIKWNADTLSSKQAQTHVGEDDDVAEERRRVQHMQPGHNESIFVKNLRQQYPGGKVALDDMCLAIPKGECFGYLGINGAGKSTTMKILTGQDAPTSGFASLGGYDLARFRDKARTVLGYCPQFDSLHDLLTVEEQLELYARLKGIPSSQVATAVDQKIIEVGLSEYRSKLTRGLSGGNKRKVSTAIALMGAPRIIFLDEPSTGVDPSSRRKMWDVIAAVCAEKESCVVLTTHSMEECEALCTRVGILVSGKLKCLGSVEHLKQKFGRGYTVEVNLGDPPAHLVQRLATEVESILGGDVPIASNNIERLSQALGAQQRGKMILDGEGNGWVLQSVLSANGTIPMETFCNWWCSENMSSALQRFFEDECIGSKLVENQGGHFRFQVPKHTLRPFVIFRLLEESKKRLHVNEYSVSDTSLEHIFNNMAAQQDEERLVVNGAYNDDTEVRGLSNRGGEYELQPSSLQSVRSFHRASFNRDSSLSRSNSVSVSNDGAKSLPC